MAEPPIGDACIDEVLMRGGFPMRGLHLGECPERQSPYPMELLVVDNSWELLL